MRERRRFYESLGSGFLSFTLPMALPSNSTGSEVTGFAGPSSFSDFETLQNPLSYRSDNVFTAHGGMIRRAGIVGNPKAYSVPTVKTAPRAISTFE